ncbi:MAG: carboxypeptidase regulatory-like domain-containing protein, partial [Archangium sp.]
MMRTTSWTPLLRGSRAASALFAGALLLTLLASPTTHAASDTTGRVAGWVYAPVGGGALSEVSVSLGGPKMPQPLQATTDNNGHYEFGELPVGGDYVLEVNVPGFTPIRQPGIKVLAGQTTPVDITLQQLTESAPGATYALVEKVSPVLNPDSAQAALTLESERVERIATTHQAANLPQNLPGVGPGTKPNTRGGLARYSKFFVDGLETTDIVDGGLTVPLNFDAIEDFEILVGAMDAQYNSLGAVMNAVTKDGTNDFRWDVNLTVSPSFLSARPQYSANTPGYFGDLRSSTAPVATATSYLPSLSLGGPLVKDKLWLFTTLQLTYNNR